MKKLTGLLKHQLYRNLIIISAFAIPYGIYTANKVAIEKSKVSAAVKTSSPEEIQERAIIKAISNARIQCEILVRSSLKDPASYKRVKSPQRNNEVLVYSATNSFGGRIQESFDCNAIIEAAVSEAKSKNKEP